MTCISELQTAQKQTHKHQTIMYSRSKFGAGDRIWFVRSDWSGVNLCALPDTGGADTENNSK